MCTSSIIIKFKLICSTNSMEHIYHHIFSSCHATTVFIHISQKFIIKIPRPSLFDEIWIVLEFVLAASQARTLETASIVAWILIVPYNGSKTFYFLASDHLNPSQAAYILLPFPHTVTRGGSFFLVIAIFRT